MTLEAAWNAAHEHAASLKAFPLRNLFAGDPDRFASFTFHDGDLRIDFSKEKLDAFSRGRLIALFEHKGIVQGATWRVNFFDQWVVEPGKALVGSLIPALRDGADPRSGTDVSTAGLIGTLKEHCS